MHRSLSDLTTRIERALDQRIIPAIHSHRQPVMVAVLHLPGEPVPAGEAIAMDYRPAAVGDRWGRGWSPSWFRLSGRVPEAMAARRVELLVDLGFSGGGPGFECEGLAYTPDAVPIKGLAPRNTYLPISDDAVGGEAVQVYVEAAANPTVGGSYSTVMGDLATVPDEPLYRLQRAELAVLEEEVYGLAMDVQVLHQLAKVLPENQARRHEIQRALEVMLDELDVHDVQAGAGQARQRLAGVLAPPANASAHRTSAVGHAHIDSAWLWPVRETQRKCARTFSNVVALAEEHPELIFACSSAQQYAWMRDHYPQVWERIRQRVASGNFVPVGGMWVEPDTNLPGGEALVRQFVQGKRFFWSEFGVDCEEVWLPDSFGYSGALPQLARLAGFRWFLSQKMSWNQTNRFPHHTFWWEGIDGTRIFTHFPPADTYSSKLSAEQLAHGAANFAELGRATRSLLPFGYGDGGGGPTREMLEVAARVADLEGSPRVRIETPAEFFAAAEAEYPDAPVWAGEMYLEFHRGTYTSQALMKQGNRRVEHLLREAELWCATATVRRTAVYPYEELDRIWQQMLLLQFHDILPGSSIAWVHREAAETYARLIAELEEIIAAALQTVAGDGRQPLLFNAAPHANCGVPALGGGTPERRGPVSVLRDHDGIVLANGLLRLVVGPHGTLTSVRDLVADREVLRAGAEGNLLQAHPDTPNRFDAWDIDEFYRHRRTDLVDVEELTLDDSDASRPVVRVQRRFGDSALIQTIALPTDERRIECALEADWHQRETLLKVAFPLDLHAERSAAETQFGHVYRPTHTNTSWDAAKFEIPAHRWLQVAEPGYGVALVNEATYGHEVTRPGPGGSDGPGPTTVRLSLLRGPLYPDPETDQGQHLLHYALVPGAEIVDAVREGYRANLALREISGAGPVVPLVSLDSGSLVIEAVKLADDRSGDVVVRLYESLGGRGSGTLRTDFDLGRAAVCTLLEHSDAGVAALAPIDVDLEARQVGLHLHPFQVVTLRLSPAPG